VNSDCARRERDGVLGRLTSADKAERIRAALDLKRNALGSEQMFRELLWSNHGARNAQIRSAMAIARRLVSNATGREKQGGVLAALTGMNQNDPETGPGAVAALRVMGMLVALYSLDTMAGYKVILDFSGRHAGAFRQEIGAMMVQRGFAAMPALVYGRGSTNKELHMFAVKWIRDMGNPLLGEQILGIQNPRRLAQLLEAYASVNDLDAIDVTVSLANHNSIFVRNAARACLAAYGRNAKWSVRRTYENTFSREPVKDSAQEDWLSELYRFWDEQRVAGTIGVFEEGLQLASDGKFQQMDDRFRQVLRDAPMFSRRAEMAAGYLKYALQLEDEGNGDGARKMNTMALRLASDGSQEARLAGARLDWLFAEEARKGGAAHYKAYQAVAAADPANGDAAKWAARLSPEHAGQSALKWKAVLISLILFVAALLVYFRLRRSVRTESGDPLP